MATKKQKREALETKRAIQAEESRLSGLKALEQERARRQRVKERAAKSFRGVKSVNDTSAA